jgi:hypothetical protein
MIHKWYKSGYPPLWGNQPQRWQGTQGQSATARVRHEERLLIFSNNPGSKTGDGGRAHAERMVNEMVQDRRLVGIFLVMSK